MEVMEYKEETSNQTKPCTTIQNYDVVGNYSCLDDSEMECIIAQLKAGDDALALKLLTAAQAGEQKAGELVLQALMPRLAWQKRRDYAHTLADYQSAAWIRIMQHPVLHRRNRVLVNIALDSLKMLSRELARAAREVPVAEVPEPRYQNLDGQEESLAKQIIDLAARKHLVPAAAIPALRYIYIIGLTSTAAAELLDMSPSMVRYYCSAAIKRLRIYRQELLGFE
ncbi:MAG: hypothetical protein LBJ43_06615 [Propionibacteriaceae bacterium]|nr:hypothetical protein [Propionibacteriaceae bacterium]